MLLTPLSVMSRSLASCPPPSFDWGGGEDADDAVGEIDDDYIEGFQQINGMAAQAYILATAEWLFWYLRDNLDPDDARDYIEYILAHWVWVCVLPRKVPPYPYNGEKNRPGRNPVYGAAVRRAFTALADGIYSLPHDETAVDAAFMTQLCEYILPKKCGFFQWRAAVLKRLKAAYPAGAASYMQVRVPRQIFDTDAPVGDLTQECAALVAEASSATDNRYLPLKEPDQPGS